MILVVQKIVNPCFEKIIYISAVIRLGVIMRTGYAKSVGDDNCEQATCKNKVHVGLRR